MKERPILFSGPMVRAILEGRKTQTRRAVKTPLYEPLMERAFAPGCGIWRGMDGSEVRCPHGAPGDRLWVRETWAAIDDVFEGRGRYRDPIHRRAGTQYRADGNGLGSHLQWRPSIFMPRWASRITLEVTDVCVERLQDISEEDAKAEGVEGREDFRRLWNDINRGRGARWFTRGEDEDVQSPWVWCISFRRVTP